MPDTDKLLSAIESYESQAYGSEGDGGELSRQRALALDSYQGKNIEPAPEGRSQVVDWSVFETVQWILPSLTRIFCGDDQVVEFIPMGPEDEEVAEQESEVLNYLITQKNNWFLTCLEWFTDALVTKNAYAMVSLDERIVPEVESYEGQSEEQVALLLQDDVEIVGSNAREDADNPVPVTDEMGQPIVDPFTGEPLMQPRVVYDVEVRRTKAKKQLRFDVLPPERVMVGEDTPDFTLADANYFEYFERCTISELRKMGFEIDDDIADEGLTDSREDTARDDIFQSRYGELESTDPASRQVKVRNIWIRHDYDEDGIAELQKVVLVGTTILSHEPASRIPVACIVPFLNTHRHVGMSVADLVFDIQRIKTAMMRSALDSLYLATNPRHIVNANVNIDDLLVSRPGGVVRTKSTGVPVGTDIMPLQTENTFPYAQQGLQHMDSVIESRVGVNRMFQGIDTRTMSGNNSYDQVGQLSTMAAQRVEQIARIFANGVECLFSLAHECIIKSGHSMDAIKLRGEWVNIDPTQWRTGRDMRVVAPFAAGNKDSLVQRLMVHMNIHREALAAGAPFVQMDDTYNLAKMLASATDVAADKIYTDPQTIEPPPPPPDYTMMALEVENKKADNQAQDSQLDAEVKSKQIDTDAYVKELVARIQSETQIALAQIKGGQQVDLKQFEASLKNAPVELGNQAIEATGSAVQQLSAQIDVAMRALNEAISEVQADASAPIKIVRDGKGKITGKEVNGKFIPLEDK